MTFRKGWQRVSRSKPCPVCDHPDWCLISEDDGAAICSRVESANRRGEAGWLHQLRDTGWQPSRRAVRSRVIGSTCRRSDLAELAETYRKAIDLVRLDALARMLGLSVESLRALGIGWAADRRAWSFPMVDVAGIVLGIRLRGQDGSKFAVKGGHEGLFVPRQAETVGGRLLICEGPTDTAALLDLGFSAVVGRPSCTGGIKLLCELVQQRRHADVAIVADGDEPGRRGADNLALVLRAYVPAVRVVVPSRYKDVREFLRAGGTRKQLEQAIAAAPARPLLIQRRKA